MSKRFAILAVLGLMAGGIAAAPDAMARPDDTLQHGSKRQALERNDLERTPETQAALRRAQPKPSQVLRQRELVGRALAVEFQTWARISSSYDPDVYALYVANFPRGLFAPLARARAMYLLERREHQQALGNR